MALVISMYQIIPKLISDVEVRGGSLLSQLRREKMERRAGLIVRT